MLIAEDVLLLLVDDRTGRFLVDSTTLDNVLAGAVLVELVTIERVGFAPAGGGIKRVWGSITGSGMDGLPGWDHR